MLRVAVLVGAARAASLDDHLAATLDKVMTATSTEDCQCFANGEENEAHCEGGGRATRVPTLCNADERCHWGPEEIPACIAMLSAPAAPTPWFDGCWGTNFGSYHITANKGTITSDGTGFLSKIYYPATYVYNSDGTVTATWKNGGKSTGTKKANGKIQWRGATGSVWKPNTGC